MGGADAGVDAAESRDAPRCRISASRIDRHLIRTRWIRAMLVGSGAISTSIWRTWPISSAVGRTFLEHDAPAGAIAAMLRNLVDQRSWSFVVGAGCHSPVMLAPGRARRAPSSRLPLAHLLWNGNLFHGPSCGTLPAPASSRTTRAARKCGRTLRFPCSLRGGVAGWYSCAGHIAIALQRRDTRWRHACHHVRGSVASGTGSGAPRARWRISSGRIGG